MATYQPRTIQFCETVSTGDWRVKVYTISQGVKFGQTEIYKKAVEKIPEWLEITNGFDNTHESCAFLILHEGNEGVFTLLNWWVGKNMLNTHIFLTAPGGQPSFQKISGAGLGPCIWELEIINHERESWIQNVLKSNEPKFDQYLADVVNKTV